MLDQLPRNDRKRLTRAYVLQGILNLYSNPRYLEIGVATGVTFHEISAEHKVAVDPKFRFDVEEARRQNPHAFYHPVTSDEYFGALISPADQFDVIYLDGLHTSEQTLRDLLNATQHLAQRGVIVIDDTIPKNYAASLVDRREANVTRSALKIKGGAWMGDVFRLAFFIETFMQQFAYHTIADNHGQIVLWREPRLTVPERTIEDVGRKEYKSLFVERDAFRFESFDAILQKISGRLAS